MRILHIGKYYPPFMGGIENFMHDLMHEQVKQGNDIAALVHQHDTEMDWEIIHDDQVTIFKTPIKGQVVFTPIALNFYQHLGKVIKVFKPDIIHLHLPNPSTFWCLFHKQAKELPWVIHWHADVLGNVPDTKVKLLYPFYAVFERRLLRRAKQVIATSPNYLNSSEPLANFIDKTQVVSLGLKTLPYEVKQANEDGKHIELLMVGRLTYYKGHRVMLNALSKLVAQNINVKLTIIGGGELRRDIESQISQLNLNEHVKLLGKVSDERLIQALSKAHLLCLPSLERTEAFGVVLLEAARQGIPALVSDVPGSGMSWVVDDKKTGLVVKTGCTDSIVSAVKSLEDPLKTLKEYGLQAKIKFNEQFRISAVANQLQLVYNATVSKNK